MDFVNFIQIYLKVFKKVGRVIFIFTVLIVNVDEL